MGGSGQTGIGKVYHRYDPGKITILRTHGAGKERGVLSRLEVISSYQLADFGNMA